MSRKRTGRDFRELHIWIDEPKEELGIDHHSKRHFWSRSTEKEIVEYWNKKEDGIGKIAVEEWLFHIALDNLFILFKKVEYNNPMKEKTNFLSFGFPGGDFVYYEDGKHENEIMKRIFEIIKEGKKQ